MTESLFAADLTDLGDLMTSFARAAVKSAVAKGLAFFFDYRGPTLNVAETAAQLEDLVVPLLQNAVNGLAGGCIFFSVDVALRGRDQVSVLVQVAESGAPTSEKLLHHLHAATSRAASAAFASPPRPRDEAARQACSRLGGTLVIGRAPGEARVVRADLSLKAEGVTEDITTAIPQGHTAWLIGDPPVVFESTVRRLHRLGWKVRLMPSVGAAAQYLRDNPSQAPDVVLGIERYKVCMDAYAHLSATLPASTAVLGTLHPDSPLRPDPLGFVGRMRVMHEPLSPRELHQMTVRTLAKSGKKLRKATTLDVSLQRQPRALLVEDNPVNQMLSTEILQVFGFEVDLAANGREALAHCQRDLPAIIVMDVNMPVMDGFETTVRIRELERKGILPHIPIIAATAQTTPADRRRALDVGMNGFVPKPLDIALLQREIHRVLDKSPFELIDEEEARSA